MKVSKGAKIRNAYIDVPQPLINDLWFFLFQKMDAECVK